MNLSDNGFPDAENKDRAIVVSLSVPGYYSAPVRLLTLMANNDQQVSRLWNVRYAEWDNNADVATCCRELLAAKPSLVAFSVNIWNLPPVQELSAMLKAEKASLTILCGGQEVTHSSIDFLETTPSWDYLIDGEGELPFLQFLRCWDRNTADISDREQVSGLRYRDAGTGTTQLTRPAETVDDLNELPSIILRDMVPATGRNRLGVMIEGARGCPFKCSFCFEGYCDRKVRFANIQTMEKEVRFMLEKGARLFHLLDPIVASHDQERTGQIMRIFTDAIKDYPDLHLTVEGYAERMDEAVCAELGQSFVSIDVGLQSFNPETLKAIRRPFRKERFLEGVHRLQQTPVWTSIYLICGLPYETSATYLAGIKQVVQLEPNQLFLNELIMLNGTELRNQANTEDWGYDYNHSPPYDVYGNRWIPAKAMTALNAYSATLAGWYNNSGITLADRRKRLNSNSQTVHVVLEKSHLYVLENDSVWRKLSANASEQISNTAVLLHIEEADKKAINTALTRLRFLECARITIVLSQTRLNNDDTPVGLGLLHVTVDSPETLAADLLAYAKRDFRGIRMHSCCIELIWPANTPLPVDPAYYRALESLPLTLTISLGKINPSTWTLEEFRQSIDAAHAAGIWLHAPAGSHWRKTLLEYIWNDANDLIETELDALDQVLTLHEAIELPPLVPEGQEIQPMAK